MRCQHQRVLIDHSFKEGGGTGVDDEDRGMRDREKERERGGEEDGERESERVNGGEKGQCL